MDIKTARVALLSFDGNRFNLKRQLERIGIGCVDIYADSSKLPAGVLYDLYIVDEFFTAGATVRTLWVPQVDAIRSFYPKAKIMLMSVLSSDEKVARTYAVEFFDYASKSADFNERIPQLLKAVDDETTHGTVRFDNCSVYWRPLNEDETKCIFGILDYDGPRLEEVFDREPPMYPDDGQHIGDFLKLLWERLITKLTEHPVEKKSLPIPFEQLISIANFYSITDLESSLTPALRERYL